MNTNFKALSNAIVYLNQTMALPIRHAGVPLVYRITVDADTVQIDGFQANVGETTVDVDADFKNGILWVAPQCTAWADYSVKYDGGPNTVVRLNTPLREARYEAFVMDEGLRVFSLQLLNDIATVLLDSVLSDESSDERRMAA